MEFYQTHVVVLPEVQKQEGLRKLIYMHGNRLQLCCNQILSCLSYRRCHVCLLETWIWLTTFVDGILGVDQLDARVHLQRPWQDKSSNVKRVAQEIDECGMVE